MKPIKPKDKILIAMLSAILAMMLLDALQTTVGFSRAIDGIIIERTYKVWVWELDK